MSIAISQNQNAFIKGCQISDNIMVGFEGIHNMKWRKFQNGAHAALKLDMAVAHPRDGDEEAWLCGTMDS